METTEGYWQYSDATFFPLSDEQGFGNQGYPDNYHFTTEIHLEFPHWVEEVFTRVANGGAGEAKCAGNYGASLLPAQRAKANGYDQVMWMDADEKKYVQEVGTMNLFFVIDDRVITPATTGTILRGITRDSFLTLLKDWGYTVEDRLLSIAEITDAYWRGLR